MIQSVPNEAAIILTEYVHELASRLPNRVEGIYLHGSITLHAFDERSDIDFITLINNPLSKEEKESVKAIHQQIAERYTSHQLEGAYLSKEEFGQNNHHSVPFYDGDEFIYDQPFYNHNPVTWWTLKHHGITVFGKELKEISFDDHSSVLVDYVKENMNSYWKNRFHSIKELDYSKFPKESINAEIEWSVLGVLRQVYTINEQKVTSKIEAGEYGLEILPHRWHDVIREAVRIRLGRDGSYYHSEEDRIHDFLTFLDYIFSNNTLEKSGV
ncbi:aminoglycoside adenylyltransferase domain-containing protein [Bacillus salitolerans]|uniref:Aminoglycoside adenylyltransferase domain-containing protein n=1 Tax=Bacillus salitolerans TaxID=1437434 RepID=A0ABW4LUM5_9BACI